MAADDIAKGALRLIKWGKELLPSDVSNNVLRGNRLRLESLYRMIPELSADAKLIAADARQSVLLPKEVAGMYGLDMNRIRGVAHQQGRIFSAPDAVQADEEAFMRGLLAAGDRLPSGKNVDFAKTVSDAATAEATQHVIGNDMFTEDLYKPLTSALAAGRRFERTVDNAPEGFTAIARTLGERGLITGPKSIEAARRLSMESPTLTQIVTTFVQDGMSLEDALAAARALGL
jgi:hypothetical protein